MNRRIVLGEALLLVGLLVSLAGNALLFRAGRESHEQAKAAVVQLAQTERDYQEIAAVVNDAVQSMTEMRYGIENSEDLCFQREVYWGAKLHDLHIEDVLIDYRYCEEWVRKWSSPTAYPNFPGWRVDSPFVRFYPEGTEASDAAGGGG